MRNKEKMRPKLSVNIDHVATLRQARMAGDPDLVRTALLCERAGARGITVHLRQDRRHIQDKDLFLLRKKIRTRLDVEVSCAPAMIQIVLAVNPQLVTLVPERVEELTTEGGLDVIRQSSRIHHAMKLIHQKGIAVSLFVDPLPAQILASKKIGAEVVEINTGQYAETIDPRRRARELRSIREAVQLSLRLGLRVNAGHGLNYTNIRPITAIQGIDEFNIGFHIIARAVTVGIPQAVTEMVKRVAS